MIYTDEICDLLIKIAQKTNPQKSVWNWYHVSFSHEIDSAYESYSCNICGEIFYEDRLDLRLSLNEHILPKHAEIHIKKYLPYL